MFHELNSDGYRNREYRPYILGEATTYNTVLYDPYRNYNTGMYKTETHTLQSYENNVKEYFNLPRREPPLRTMQNSEGALKQFLHLDAKTAPMQGRYQMKQQLENSYSPNNRGGTSSYAMLYST